MTAQIERNGYGLTAKQEAESREATRPDEMEGLGRITQLSRVQDKRRLHETAR